MVINLWHNFQHSFQLYESNNNPECLEVFPRDKVIKDVCHSDLVVMKFLSSLHVQLIKMKKLKDSCYIVNIITQIRSI